MFNINQNIDRVELGPGNPSDIIQRETLSRDVLQYEGPRSPS